MILELRGRDLLQLSGRPRVLPPPGSVLLQVQGLFANNLDQISPELGRAVIHVAGSQMIGETTVIPGEGLGLDVASESLDRLLSCDGLVGQHGVHCGRQVGTDQLSRRVEQVVAASYERGVCAQVPVLVQADEFVALALGDELEFGVSDSQQLPFELLQLDDLVLCDSGVE
ncbi:hypothetical protein ACIP4T_31935 [Streptomyces massasporeus]|uniref:hypothetical protein n=1 Tax=Streptomyces massasporeus TaxID=67324 RepID=UPI0036E0F626